VGFSSDGKTSALGGLLKRSAGSGSGFFFDVIGAATLFDIDR
jgi:hypothetical protein